MNKQQLLEELEPLHTQLCDQWYELVEEWEEEHELPDWEIYVELKHDVSDYWFSDKEKEARMSQEFVGIGQMGEGSMAAIWLIEGRNLSNAPVVLIGSEGEVSVLANNYKNFMLLAGMGYNMYELHEVENPAGAPEEVAFQPFLDWVESEKNWKIIADVYAEVNSARANNPDLLAHLGI